MARLSFIILLSLVFTSTYAIAEDKGMYVSGEIGASFLSNTESNMPGVFTSEIKSDTGFRVGGALGYDFGKFRAEGEISYRTNDTDEGVV